MVVVSRKFNREMPVGSVVRDVEFPNDGPFHVTRQAHTSSWGTEIGLVTDSGEHFTDFAKYYAFVI